MIANELVRQANGYDVDAASLASGVRCEDESLTLQSQRDEADINILVRRFGATGVIPAVEMPEALVGHVESFDMMTAQNLMVDARNSFMSLEANVRERFGNDPLRFVQFCSDKDNLAELRKLGLAKPEVVVPPEVVQKVRIVEEDVGGDERRVSRGGGRKAARAGGVHPSDSVED